MAGGRHLLALIEDLLDFSRLNADSLERSRSRSRAQIADAVSLCAPLAAERVLTVTVDAGDEPLSGVRRPPPPQAGPAQPDLERDQVQPSRRLDHGPGPARRRRRRPRRRDRLGSRHDLRAAHAACSSRSSASTRRSAGSRATGSAWPSRRLWSRRWTGRSTSLRPPAPGSVFSVRLLAAEAVAAGAGPRAPGPDAGAGRLTAARPQPRAIYGTLSDRAADPGPPAHPSAPAVPSAGAGRPPPPRPPEPSASRPSPRARGAAASPTSRP